jgi:hypothetical protein
MLHTPILTIRREQAPDLRTISHIPHSTDRPRAPLQSQQQVRDGDEVIAIQSHNRQGNVPSLAQTTQTDQHCQDTLTTLEERQLLHSRL